MHAHNIFSLLPPADISFMAILPPPRHTTSLLCRTPLPQVRHIFRHYCRRFSPFFAFHATPIFWYSSGNDRVEGRHRHYQVEKAQLGR